MQRNACITKKISINLNDESSLQSAKLESENFRADAAKARLEAHQVGRNFHSKKTVIISGDDDEDLPSKSATAHRKNSMFDLPPIIVDEKVMNDLKAVIAGEKDECEIDDPIIVDDEVFAAIKAEIGEDKSCHMCGDKPESRSLRK
jgi:hypothetical protein